MNVEMGSLMKSLIKKVWNKLGIKWPIYNVNHTNYKKNALMMYITAPFDPEAGKGCHQNYPQSREIAKIIGDLGYNVDVLDYNASWALLKNKYDLIFDICVKDKPVYRKALRENAKKIVYFTGSESEVANNAEQKRLQELAQRRGCTLQPRRQAPQTAKTIELFDGAIMIGNAYNLQTYSAFSLPQSFLVPNTGYDFGDRFDYRKKKRNCFLFFGSSGAVHKGLDRLLEVFAEKDFPAILYVCGNFKNEKDFSEEYETELYHTDNIKAVGFVDIWSQEFVEIANTCTYTVLPSCAEGMAGTITTAMSAGIIPICSRECGYEENEVITLPDCEIDTIRQVILECASKSPLWIEQQREKARELVRTKYSEAGFSSEMRYALEQILMNKGAKKE